MNWHGGSFRQRKTRGTWLKGERSAQTWKRNSWPRSRFIQPRDQHSETFMVAGLPLLRHKRERRSHGDRVFDGTVERAVVGIDAVHSLGRLPVVRRSL